MASGGLRNLEEPGGAWRNQEEPEGARKSQEEPGGGQEETRKTQGEPGELQLAILREARRSQDDTGSPPASSGPMGFPQPQAIGNTMEQAFKHVQACCFQRSVFILCLFQAICELSWVKDVKEAVTELHAHIYSHSKSSGCSSVFTLSRIIL